MKTYNLIKTRNCEYNLTEQDVINFALARQSVWVNIEDVIETFDDAASYLKRAFNYGIEELNYGIEIKE